MRRVAVVAATVLVALAGALALVAFLQARDDSRLETSAAPGVAARETDPRLAAGNVILTFRDPADGRALRALARDVAGPPDDTLVEAGQAVIVLRRPNQRTGPVVAHAARRQLVAERGDDPEIRRFVEYWLGRASAD